MFLNESIYDIKDYTDTYGNKIKKKRMNMPFPVLNGKIETGEVLEKLDHVYIDGLYEIGSQEKITDATNFKVDYNNGTVYVHESKEGLTLNLDYTAKAQIRYKAKNVMVEDIDNNFVNDNVENVLKETADRINNLVLNTSNPAEVTDAHLDSVNNITSVTLKQRLDRHAQDIKNNKNNIGDLSGLNNDNIGDELRQVNESLNDIVQDVGTLETNKAEKIEVNNVQSQINALVLGAVGSGNNAEVVQAKVDIAGIMHSVLKERIDKIEANAFDYSQYGYINLSDAGFSSGWSRVVTNKIPMLIKGTVYVTFKAYGANQYIQHVRLSSDPNVASIVKTVSLTATSGSIVTAECSFDIVGDGKDYITISGCYFKSTNVSNGYVQLLTTFDINRTTYSNFANALNMTADMGFYITVIGAKQKTSADIKFLDAYSYKGSTSDCNLATAAGDYIITDGALNSPITSGFLNVAVMGDFIVHKAIGYNVDGIIYMRKKRISTGVWSSWVASQAEQILPLSGKVGVNFGDSITEFGNYPDIISQVTGATMYNVGIGGTRLAYDSDNTNIACGVKLIEYIVNETLDSNSSAVYNNTSITALGKEHYTTLRGINFANVDFVCFAYGTNDYWAGITLDGGSDTDQTKFKDSLRYCIKSLLTKYPHLQIFVFTPSYRNRYNSGNDPVTTNSNVKANSLGLYLIDYENALDAVCGEYQIPCLKMYKKCGINIINAAEWLTDGLHRTTKGYEKLGRQYGEFIIDNF